MTGDTTLAALLAALRQWRDRQRRRERRDARRKFARLDAAVARLQARVQAHYDCQQLGVRYEAADPMPHEPRLLRDWLPGEYEATWRLWQREFRAWLSRHPDGDDGAVRVEVEPKPYRYSREELLLLREWNVYYLHVVVHDCRRSLADCAADYCRERDAARQVRRQQAAVHSAYVVGLPLDPDVHGRRQIVTESEVRKVAGLPARDEILALGPAQ